MELWVRSQCGELLEKAEMIKVGTTDSGKTYSIIVNNDYVYADYKTKERALEVLDEIQGKITQNECLKLMIPKLSNVKGEEEKIGKLFKEMIYEMPKE